MPYPNWFRSFRPAFRIAVRAALFAAFCASARAAAQGAALSGSVVLVNSGDRAVRKHRDYSSVVVWLEPAGNSAAPAAPARSLTATMAQKNKTFIPHVLAVEVGTTVHFPNYDPIFHNVFSNYDGQIFDVNLYAPQTSRSVVFHRPGMVRIFCNIHATMSAMIAVLPTPYFAVSGPDGKFEIRAPAGEYTLQVWHERSQAAVLAGLRRRITLGPSGQILPEIRVSEEGYLPVPHKNKYGQDYAPAPQDHVFYPGGK